jgi:hypothetical protein
MDNFIVGPSKNVAGDITTAWVSYTPTITGFGTASSVAFEYRRNGDSIDVRGKFVAGTTTAVEAQLGLPPGFTSADTTKIPSIKIAGLVGFSINASNTHLLLIEPSVAYFTVGFQASASGVLGKRNGNALISSGDTLVLAASGIPVAGWGATATLGQDADTRVVAMRAQAATPTGPTDGSGPVVYGTAAIFDTHGSYSTSTGRYTVPVGGFYLVTASVSLTGTEANNQFIILSVNKNATTQQQSVARLMNTTLDDSGTTAVNCLVQANAGDLLDVRLNTNITGVAYNANANNNFIQVTRMSGPSQIAASEVVALSANGTTSTVSSSQATVAPWTTTEVDTNGSFNATTGVWTCPAAGVYSISAQLRFGWASIAVGNALAISVYKNNTTDLAFNFETAESTSTTVKVLNVDRVARLIAGDTIRIQASNAATTPNLSSSAAYGLFQIVRVGQ